MRKIMKVSIIVISYNEKLFLQEAFDSCLSQKLNYDYEIIIGDDGSNGGSIELILEHEKKYELFRHLLWREKMLITILHQ